MRIIINGKRLQTCLLLCSLLLLEYINFGILYSVQPKFAGVSEFNMASAKGAARNTSMSHNDYDRSAFLAAIEDFTRFNIASTGKSGGPGYKPNYVSFPALSASHAAVLINYLRLSKEIYYQFDSIQITTFLHKKDGMK